MLPYRPRFVRRPTAIVPWQARPFRLGAMALLLFSSNAMTHYFSHSDEPFPPIVETASPSQDLYLMEKARPFLQSEELFREEVNRIASHLHIPNSWLMAVMYAESSFDAQVYNHRGSGAVGLIQFMPTTARELGYSSQEIALMSPSRQLSLVGAYFEQVRQRYGAYDSLTDLYLAVLYPKARKQDPCYTLYAQPSQSYRQNSGLDENKDGRVTVNDIRLRMQRLFPQAAAASQPS